MLKSPTYGILVGLLVATAAGAQQDQGSLGVLERIAVRAALERAVGSMEPRLRLVIDPMIVHPNEAPGGRDSTRRSPERLAYLADAFGARAAERSTVIDCEKRPCTLRNADVLISLSQPEIDKDRAKVTVTTVRQTKRGIQYTTVNVVMRSRGNTWDVVGFEELGIS